MGFRPIRGLSAAVEPLAFALLIIFAGCNYGFRGGGGLPSHIRTVFISTFENQSDNFRVPALLFDELRSELPATLGLQLAGEGNADAVVRGRVMGYRDEAQAYRPGERGNIDVEQHEVQITITIEIVDVSNNVILWDAQSLMGRGQYRQANQDPSIGEAQAIESIRQQIIDGMQSQW